MSTHTNLSNVNVDNIRRACLKDIPGLTALENECWPEPLRAPQDEIRRRIEQYGAGQVVCEIDNVVVGVIYSQRISGIDCLTGVSCDNVSTLHTGNGAIAQLLAVNVLPSVGHFGVGDQLLNFMLDYYLEDEGLERVVAVTLCGDFDKGSGVSMEDYVCKRDEWGQLIDGILRFHERHGAKIIKLVPGFRPMDVGNLGNGVLVEYDKAGRDALISTRKDAVLEVNDRAALSSAIEKFVCSVKGACPVGAYSAKTALLDMGLSSLDLFGLRMVICRLTGADIDPAFFFRYSTPDSIVAYFFPRESGKDKDSHAGAGNQPAPEPATSLKQISVKNVQDNLAHGERSVAIIGMACRFPDGADSLDEYWRLLRNGEDAITEIPEHRKALGLNFDSNVKSGKMALPGYGGFLDNVDTFDARFFNITSREASNIDPQQRLLLELTWEALENAGINPESLAGSQTGVYVGVFSNDYELLQLKYRGEEGLDSFFATGTSPALIAGRVSYVFGFNGPAVSVNTACSSSLAAVHMARQSLLNNECGIAIASGVNLLLSPELNVAFAESGMLSPDGRCKTFDAGADGYVRSEGGGALVLKPLLKAIEDNDNIFAILRGSALNHDGASNGLTAPNGIAQEAVINKALLDGGITPGDVSYIEAHGTGTELGDPVEFKAVENVFAPGRADDNPLFVGSVKTNIGHAEAAAGIAGVIKTALSMRNNYIPPHLHLKNLNPLMLNKKQSINIPTKGLEWPGNRANKKRMAGVSSFGFSGTNAHLILEEAGNDYKNRMQQEAPDKGSHLLVLSAKDENALKELAQRYAEHLMLGLDESLADICYTANSGRAHFGNRLAIAAESTAEAAENLNSFIVGRSCKGLTVSNDGARKGGNVAFLFTGQGSQYINMGRELYETQTVFRDIINECGETLNELMDTPLLDLLYPCSDETLLLNQTQYTQPALFALEYALAGLWASWGVRPQIVTGHSVGEYVAACVAGVFSLKDGLKLIAHRASLMGALPENGAMWAVFADESTVVPAIAQYAEMVAIAAVNGPKLVVVSGDADCLKKIIDDLDSNGVSATRLNVSHAFHSPLMEPMLNEFKRIAGEVSYSTPSIPVISNVSGEVAGPEILNPDYWARHVVSPVQFASGMDTLFRSGYEMFLEIGPKPVLSGMGRRLKNAKRSLWLHSLNEGASDWGRMILNLGGLYVNGVDIDWQNFYCRRRRNRVELPTYPFQRQRHWLDVNPSLNRYKGATSKGNVADAVRVLERSGSFTDDELELAPRLLKALAGQSSGNVELGAVEDDIFNVEWKVVELLKRFESADYMPAPAQINNEMGTDDSKYRNKNIDLLNRLENLSVAYVLQAFEKLGWALNAGVSFSLDEAANRLGVVDRHKRLLRHLLMMLTEENILEQNSSGWVALKNSSEDNPDKQHEQLLSQYPDAEAELTILGRCGSNLNGVIRGETDPMQLIFPSADVAAAARLYQDSPTFGGMNAALQQTISTILRYLPVDRKIRILEIGAGTGGSTSHILPHLPPARAEYVFTDISNLFILKARERFADYPFVKYGLLDIEDSDKVRAFDTQQFDIVIASNALHATCDMRQTLDNARLLLAPGGALALIEGTGRRRWIDLIFGLLDGWWRFSDYGLRPAHPLLSVEQWQKLLLETGYDSASAMFSAGSDEGELFPQSVIVARNQMNEPGLEMSKGMAGEKWIIIAGKAGLGAKQAAMLRERGAGCVVASYGASYERLGSDEFTIDPAKADDFKRLMGESGVEFGLNGIIHLCGHELADPENVDEATIEEESVLWCRSVLYTVQALDSFHIESVNFWLITQGAQRDINLISGAAQSTIWGLGRVIMREHPKFQCRLADIDPFDAAQGLQMLRDEIQFCTPPDAEPFLSFYDGARRAARFARALNPANTDGQFVVNPEGSYLITGGLGGVGLNIASWLVKSGAKHLVLIGRTVSIETATDKIMGLKEKGCEVTALLADVSNKDELAGVFNKIKASMPPLKGIFHCAGIFDDKLLSNQDWGIFEKVFAAKVRGAWNLHLLSHGENLEIFALFSSIFSVLAEPGLGNYAAANSFMDALARYRNALGLAGLSVNWGPWAGVGMAKAVGEKREEQWAARGIGTLTTERALQCLEVLIKRGVANAVAASLNVQKLVHGFSNDLQQSFFSDLATGEDGPVIEVSGVLQRLEIAPVEKRRDILSEYVSSLTAGSLGFNLNDSLDVEKGFFQLGMDSLTSMEMRNRLESGLNRSFPSTLLFKYPSIVSLTDYLTEELFAERLDTDSANGAAIIEGSKKSLSAYNRDALKNSVDDLDEMPEEQLEDAVEDELVKLERLLDAG